MKCQKQYLTPLILVLCCFSIISCSSEFSGPRNVGGLGAGSAIDRGMVPRSPNRMPWEVWAFDLDLAGDPITDPYIVRGDALLQAGKRDEALSLYIKALGSRLPFVTREALIVRIASVQLAVDRPKDALITLSQFFRENSLDTTKVEPRFAIIFAYAYGRINDIDQSLAWFSRLDKMSGGNGSLNHSAILGIALLLRTIDNNDLNHISQIWAGDSFIYSNIAEERIRRQRLGPNFSLTSKEKPFWSLDPSEKTIAGNPSMTGGVTGSAVGLNNLGGNFAGAVVGVILPFSGRYSNLGQSTIKGIELALADSNVRIVAKDDMGDANVALQMAKTIVSETKPSIVLGPLLSDPATQVVPFLKDIGVPELSFSRKDLPLYGETAFQLGASTGSQIESILRAVGPVYGIKRYAIVYPDNSVGFEFVSDFRKIVAELGYKVSFEAAYGEDYRQTMLGIAEQLETSDVEAIFFPDDIDKATVLLSNLTPAFRKRVKIIGSAAWDDVQKLSSSKTILEGSLFVSPFFDRSQRDLIKRFKEIYKKRYGVDPDFLAAQGFDAATLALAAINRQYQEGIPFLTGFRAIDQYEGLTGSISVDQDGRFKRLFSVVELTENGLREVSAPR